MAPHLHTTEIWSWNSLFLLMEDTSIFGHEGRKHRYAGLNYFKHLEDPLLFENL